MNKTKAIEILGWCGAAAILVAYALLSFDVIAARSVWYQGLSGLGAVGIAVDAFYKKDLPPAALNIIWIVIAIISIARIIK